MSKILDHNWYFEKKMKQMNFDAATAAQIKKHLREYGEFRESLQREICALRALSLNSPEDVIKAIRSAYPYTNEIHHIRKQMEQIRMVYKNEFSIVKEFQCLGEYLINVVAMPQTTFAIDRKKKYIVRIFADGFTAVFNPDKPSQFFESTFIANTNNLRKIKKSLIHLSQMEESSPILQNIKF